MKLYTLLLTLWFIFLVPLLFAQESETISGPKPIGPQIISGYQNYQVIFSQRAKEIAFLQSKYVSNTRNQFSASTKKNNSKVYLVDGTLNYQYLNSFINYGEGPKN